MFWVFLQLNWKLIGTSYHKKTVICFLVAKYAALNFIAPTICFSLLKTKLGLLKLYIAKKGIVAFLLVKHIAINFAAQKPSFGLFAVKLCCCKRYWTCRRFSSSLHRVTLLLTWFYSKHAFCFRLANLRSLGVLPIRTTFPSFFRKQLWRSISPKKSFGLLLIKWGCFQPYVTKNSVFAFLSLEHAAFSFIAGKIYFGLFCRKIRLFPALLHRKKVFLQFEPVTLIFTWLYSKQRFRLFSAKLRYFRP